jgi:hypothetical protein
MKTSCNMLAAPLIVVLLAATASLFMVTGAEAGRVSVRPVSIAAALSQAPAWPNQPARRMVGEINGTVAATVAKADDPKGLTIRSEPSSSGRPVAYLALGATVNGPTVYKDGWVKVDAPPYHGWVSSANLQAVGGLATVASVDRPENCLRIRSGPSTSYPVVECARIADKLVVTGFWSNNNWAVLQDKGWVYGPQINAASKPARSASAGPAERVRTAVQSVSRGRSTVFENDFPVEEFIPSYDYSYDYYEPYWSYWPEPFYWTGGHRRHYHFMGHSVHPAFRSFSFRGYRGGGGRRR